MASDSVDAKKKKEQEELAKAGNANRNPKHDSSGKRIPQAQRQARAAQNSTKQQSASNPMKGGSNSYKRRESGPAVGSDKRDKHGHKIKNMSEAEIMSQPLHDYEGGRLVADCKRAKSMGHKLGWGCKLLLSRLKQDQAGPGDSEKGISSGKAMPYSDLDMEFKPGRYIMDDCKDKQGMQRMQQQYGNDLIDSEKYSADMEIKQFHKGQGDDPFNYKHNVRAANCGGRRCKGCRYVQAPMFDTTKMREQQVKQLLTEFFQDKEAFLRNHPEAGMETIVVMSILKEDEDEDIAAENAMKEGASAAQPLAASQSSLDDEPVTFEDIIKTREIIKCSSAKAKRQFEHIEESEEESGKSKEEAEKIAGATVNKEK